MSKPFGHVYLCAKISPLPDQFGCASLVKFGVLQHTQLNRTLHPCYHEYEMEIKVQFLSERRVG